MPTLQLDTSMSTKTNVLVEKVLKSIMRCRALQEAFLPFVITKLRDMMGYLLNKVCNNVALNFQTREPKQY